MKMISQLMLLFGIVLHKDSFGQKVSISPIGEARVALNGDLDLQCSRSGSNAISTVCNWYMDEEIQGSVNYDSNQCFAYQDLQNKTLYHVQCLQDSVFILRILNVGLNMHGQSWSCRQTFDIIIGSNLTQVYVSVPVTSVMINVPSADTVTWRENTALMLECRASESRPTPKITWNLKDGSTQLNQITSDVSQLPLSGGDDLSVTVGKLKYSPTRLVNGWQIYCSADGMNSSTKTLNITYPPNSTMIDNYVSGSTFSMFPGVQQTLTCKSIDGKPQPTLTWSCFTGSDTNSVTGTTVSSQRRWTTNTGGQCTCTSSHLYGNQSYSLNVFILAAVSDVKFHISYKEVSGNIKVIRDSDTPIVCSASGTPNITYRWQHGTNTVVNDKQLNPRDIQQDGTYTCIANNALKPSLGLQQQHNTSSSVDITRLYPATPEIQYRNKSGPVINGQLTVVKDQTFSLHCHSASSPDSTYIWNRHNYNNDLLTVSGLMDNEQVKCTSKTTMVPTVGTRTTQYRNISVSIQVLKPPTKPSITYHYDSTTTRHGVDNIKVIKEKSFNISCSSTGKPSPAVTWSTGKTSDIMTFFSVTKQEAGIYSCMAHNNMNTSYDGVFPGTSQNNISINVLYEPIVKEISDFTWIEGNSPGNPVVCYVTPGYPSKTEIKWMRGQNVLNNGQGTSLQLPLNTVNRNQDGTYECIAENRMDPTIGQTVDGRDSKQFKLTVYYNTSLTKFEVLDHPGVSAVTVMENETTPFNCSSDSKPGSTIYIHKGPAEVLKTQNNTNMLQYTIQRTGCLDSGTYTCTGYNAEIGQATRPSKHLKLNVKCGPRLSPINDTELNQTSSLNSITAIRVYILAYPAPTVEQLVWKKKTNSTWTVVKGDRMTNIVSTSGIITNSSLEIQNVQQSDFGEYQLHVEHEIFNTNITIFFKPKDKPSPPTNVRSEHVDTSSAGIRWSPGYDNGSPQTFVIMYKKDSESLWFNKSIDDTREDEMNITLRGLDSGTGYTVKIYAFNELGNSSAAPDISFMTAAKTVPPSPPAALIGGAVGGSVVVIAIVVLVIFFLRRNQFFKGKSGSDVELDKRPVAANDDDDDHDDEDGMRANPMYVSSGTVGAAGGAASGAAGDLYATPIKKKAKSPSAPPGGDIYAQVQKKNKPAKTEPKPKKGKAKEPKKEAQKGDVYENVQPMKGANAGTNDNTYENPNMPGPSEQPKKKNVNKDGLIYADLAFNDKLKGQKKLVIIGSDDRTPYAQVDFTKKADPLPDSDEEK